MTGHQLNGGQLTIYKFQGENLVWLVTSGVLDDCKIFEETQQGVVSCSLPRNGDLLNVMCNHVHQENSLVTFKFT